MWVKSETGKMHNLSFAEGIEIVPRGDGQVVVAEFKTEGGGVRQAELTEVKGNDIEPTAVMKRIFQSLQDGDRVLDLERSAIRARRPPA